MPKDAAKYRIVETRTLKVGDLVADYHSTEERAQGLAFLFSMDGSDLTPATAEDIADADKWPWAIVPEAES